MTSEIGRRLKGLRKRARLSSRAVAERLGIPASTYQKYEDRYRRDHLPLHLVATLVNALRPEGIGADEVWALAEPGQVASFLEAWASRATPAPAVQPAASQSTEQMWQPSDDGRRRYRRWTPLAANLSMNGERHPVLVRDISPGGACVLAEAAAKLREAADVLLEISDFGTVPAQIARRNGNEVGLRFEQKAEEANAIVDWLTPIRSAMH